VQNAGLHSRMYELRLGGRLDDGVQHEARGNMRLGVRERRWLGAWQMSKIIVDGVGLYECIPELK
jgi:hypothetical protein